MFLFFLGKRLSFDESDLSSSTPYKRCRRDVSLNESVDSIFGNVKEPSEVPLDISINLPGPESDFNKNMDQSFSEFLIATCDLNATYNNWFSPNWNKPSDHVCRYNCFVDYYTKKYNANTGYNGPNLLLAGKYNMVRFCFEIGACVEDCYHLLKLNDEIFRADLGNSSLFENHLINSQTYDLFDFFNSKSCKDKIIENDNFTFAFKLFLYVVNNIRDCESIYDLRMFMIANFRYYEIDDMKTYMRSFMNSKFSKFFKISLESNIKNWYRFREITYFNNNDKACVKYDYLGDSSINERMNFVQLENLLYNLSFYFDINIRHLRSLNNPGIRHIFRKIIFA